MQGKSLPVELSLSVRGVTITARADQISEQDGRILIQRLKQGRLAKNGETRKLRYAVSQAAARQQYRGMPVQFEHVSLLTAERSTPKETDKALATEITKLEQALTDIAAGRFPVEPNQYCPHCPFYFICPTHFRIGTPGG